MKTKVIVYTGPNCGYCVQAKNLLNQRNIEFEEKPIAEGTNLNEMLTLSGGMRTVPQIFFNERHIGGYTELREELKTTLDELTYAKLAETDAAKVESVNNVQKRVPLTIFVG